MIQKLKNKGYLVILLILSFIMTFMVIYFVMNHYRQIEEVGKNIKKSCPKYYTEIDAEYWDAEISKCPIKEGNIYFAFQASAGDDTFNPCWTEILYKQNEEIIEEVEKLDYLPEVEGKEPYAYISKGIEKNIIEKNNRKYIKINEVECLVGGVMGAVDLDAEDTRCIIISPTYEMTEKYRTKEMSIIYESNIKDNSDELYEWVKEFTNIEDYDEDSENKIFHNKLSFSDTYINSYKDKVWMIFKILLVFCFINVAFLAYYWGKRQRYEYMLKRTLGYTRKQLFYEIFDQFCQLEVGSIVITFALTFIYELIFASIQVWLKNITYGFGILIFGFLALGLFITLFPMIWILRSNPIDELRINE